MIRFVGLLSLCILCAAYIPGPRNKQRRLLKHRDEKKEDDDRLVRSSADASSEDFLRQLKNSNDAFLSHRHAFPAYKSKRLSKYTGMYMLYFKCFIRIVY